MGGIFACLICSSFFTTHPNLGRRLQSLVEAGLEFGMACLEFGVGLKGRQ